MSTSFQQVQLQISNAQPSQTIWIEMAEQQPEVVWSTGPDFESSAGINIQVVGGGALPLSGFYVNPQEVKVQTTAGGGGGGGTLSFNVTLYVAAQQGANSFSLRSRSDAGVVVMAQVGFAQPQTVNTTFTQFPLNPKSAEQ